MRIVCCFIFIESSSQIIIQQHQVCQLPLPQMLANSIFRSSFRMTTSRYSNCIRSNAAQTYNKLTSNSRIANYGYKALISQNDYAFSKYKPPLPTDIDTANLFGYINSPESPFLLFREKLSEFTMGSMYNGMYDFSREALFTLANDYHMGIPLSIITISALIRLAFIYPTIVGQLNGLRMKQIQAQTQRYKQKLRLGQQTGNMALTKQAQRQYAKVRAEKGLSMYVPMLNILQVPFLITWFFQLRDLANLGELYPQLYNSSFLWITDLTSMDYFLPVIAACITSLSLYYSPNLKKGAATNMLVQKYGHLFPFIPFFSLLFTVWFPSTLNIYWTTIACAQLVISGLMNYQPLILMLGHKPKQNRVVHIPEIKYVKAVFIEQKKRDKSQKESQQKESPTLKTAKSESNDGTMQLLTRKPSHLSQKKPNIPPKHRINK